ncbi:HUWE1-associated protein modifying stress responses-like [Acropora muricata]|uniref:HUWE1-associated protein modifying stress responses-like n=1 Tax=Acropora muricata TaxID=159855 RepID=UPI0034E5A111
MDGRDREDFEGGSEPLGFTNWEKQCIEQLETREDLDERFEVEKEQALQRLRNLFQNAATACAQLYKERHNRSASSDRLWSPFQDTANTITLLYKDGADCYKRGMDQGFQSGYQKRNRDVLSWAKKKKKIIFREDLLSYLAGRSPPRRNHEARHTLTTAVGSNEMILPSGVGPNNVDSSAQWCPFNAFATRPEINTSAFFATGGGLGSYHCPRRRSHSDANFADTESREGRKRSACSTDITMESPSHKRNRYF